MTIVSGWIYEEGGFFEGWISIVDGVIERIGKGSPPSPADLRGVVLPSPLNAHTHVGDYVARGLLPPPPYRLEEIVAPPHGLKHEILRSTPPSRLLEGMRSALKEAEESGCRALFDFREGGREGARLLREAAGGFPMEVLVLGRPQGTTREEIREVLSVSDGMGLSSLGDVPLGVPEVMAQECRERGKPLALHFSEGSREDVERALDLDPAFLVHGTFATRRDLEAVATEGVPLVLCPRSFLKFRPPKAPPRGCAREAWKAGVPLLLGTDNAMLQDLSIWNEVRVLRELEPDLPEPVLLRALVGEGVPERILGRKGGRALEEGQRAPIVVLEERGTSPLAAIFGSKPPTVLSVLGA